MTAEELKPEKILKLSGSYWDACTLHAGVKLDVFTIIGKDYLKKEDVADKLNGDKRGVKTLLNAPSAMDLLVKKEDTYAIHFCMNNPQFKARVYDLPTTRPLLKKPLLNLNCRTGSILRTWII